jgi:hypothetical protein
MSFHYEYFQLFAFAYSMTLPIFIVLLLNQIKILDKPILIVVSIIIIGSSFFWIISFKIHGTIYALSIKEQISMKKFFSTIKQPIGAFYIPKYEYQDPYFISIMNNCGNLIVYFKPNAFIIPLSTMNAHYLANKSYTYLATASLNKFCDYNNLQSLSHKDLIRAYLFKNKIEYIIIEKKNDLTFIQDNEILSEIYIASLNEYYIKFKLKLENKSFSMTTKKVL